MSDMEAPPALVKEETVLDKMAPARDSEWDEERRSREAIPAEAEDVNALSFSIDRQSSYLGASSIKAALMVMLKMHPNLRSSLAAPLSNVDMGNSYAPMRQQSTPGLKDAQRVPWSWKGQTLIDAYFKRVHVFVPMLDETSFRADYLEGQRFDSPWLALLNAVFAMGSIAAMKCDDYNHVNYYNKAMEHLPMDAFGSSHMETVQALALIGGFYLHYINRPNMANAVIGAAIRMASAMGLHRESVTQSAGDMAVVETRRRTWWSLFCLDTWATTTLGRPSFGRWGPAINIRAPEFGAGTVRETTGQQAGSLPLMENIKFCRIATQIQDMLAVSPLLRTEDRCSLDGQLLNWYTNLPWLLRTTDACAEPLYMARCVMKWRYQNLRMLLHRPVLLSLASSGLNPHTQACDSDLAAIDTCRELAAQTIDDMAREWTRNQMSGWNAVGFLYQAAMVPLVSVFWQWGSPRVPAWLRQVETVLELLEAMQEWSLAARRSREVVWRMYEASRGVLAQAQAERERHESAAAAAAAFAASAPASAMSPGAASHGGESISGAGSTIHVLTTGADGMMLPDCADLHMSPIGLEPVEGLGMMSLLDDQHGLWDLDGMNWGGGSGGGDGGGEPAETPAAMVFATGGFGGQGAAGLIPIDYALLNNNTGGMDEFAYV